MAVISVSQGCVPVKWTAPEVLYGNIAKLSSKSDVYVLVLCRSKHNLTFFSGESTIFPPESTRKKHLTFDFKSGMQ